MESQATADWVARLDGYIFLGRYIGVIKQNHVGKKIEHKMQTPSVFFALTGLVGIK